METHPYHSEDDVYQFSYTLTEMEENSTVPITWMALEPEERELYIQRVRASGRGMVGRLHLYLFLLLSTLYFAYTSLIDH